MNCTLVITAWKEPVTVRQNLEMILNPINGNLLTDFEIVLASPDEETKNAALEIINLYNFKKFIYIRDPQKGKPTAVNMAMKSANGEIIICTDGDVVLEKNALPELVKKFIDPKVGLVTGRPVSSDSKETMFGYFGNLLADVADKKRKKEFDGGSFYFVSGYLYAMRKLANLEIPADCLVDDAWITLQFIKRDFKIAYSEGSKVLIKYPTNMKEWLNQKKRSMGGYRQLSAINAELPAGSRKSRSIFEELKFVLFPLSYASSIKELIYSICLYPARLWLWIAIWWERYVHKKNFEETWSRIESTK
jgi:cellulose synthase/poly-beta-1,6-N-acetylglucosamine synthase-like glycosyltransferase